MKKKINEVFNSVIIRAWTIDDLNAIAVIDSLFYTRAIDAGISKGMVRAFKEDLKLFTLY